MRAGATVEVTLDQQANVTLLDPINFNSYRIRYFGGLATQTPYHIRVPRPGLWHIVIDLGGGIGTIRHSIRVIQ